MSRWLW